MYIITMRPNTMRPELFWFNGPEPPEPSKEPGLIMGSLPGNGLHNGK